jgi:hypothetical protein
MFTRRLRPAASLLKEARRQMTARAWWAAWYAQPLDSAERIECRREARAAASREAARRKRTARAQID